MTNDNESIKRNLDKLIELFKKFRNNISKEDMPEIEMSYMKNLDLLVSNYELIKDELTDDLVEQFGSPIKDMLSDLVNQLREELGEERKNMPGVEDNIRKIEQALSEKDITNDEINKLLDKRSDLVSKNKNIK